MSVVEYEKDVEMLVEVVELLCKELKTIKRRRYYREMYSPNRKAIQEKIDDVRFHLYGKLGRKWKGKCPKQVAFD